MKKNDNKDFVKKCMEIRIEGMSSVYTCNPFSDRFGLPLPNIMFQFLPVFSINFNSALSVSIFSIHVFRFQL